MRAALFALLCISLWRIVDPLGILIAWQTTNRGRYFIANTRPRICAVIGFLHRRSFSPRLSLPSRFWITSNGALLRVGRGGPRDGGYATARSGVGPRYKIHDDERKKGRGGIRASIAGERTEVRERRNLSPRARHRS